MKSKQGMVGGGNVGCYDDIQQQSPDQAASPFELATIMYTEFRGDSMKKCVFKIVNVNQKNVTGSMQQLSWQNIVVVYKLTITCQCDRKVFLETNA